MRPLFCFLLFTCLLFFCQVKAQQLEGAHWLFGQGNHLDFRNNPPLLSNYAQTNGYLIATISNSVGDLLFYSEGNYVFDAYGNILPGSLSQYLSLSPFGGGGGNAPLIVKSPGSNNRYFLFALTYGNLAPPGSGFLMTTEVDMSLNNGLGDFAQPSVKLRKHTFTIQAALQHANGIDTWVVAPNYTGDTIHTFLVSSSGVSLTTSTYSAVNVSAGGYLTKMKSSPNSELIAIGSDSTYLFAFNRSTGIPTYWMSLPVAAGVKSNAVAFSPDNTKLYVGEGKEDNSLNANLRLLQYDLTSQVPAQIEASEIQLHTFFGRMYADMQLAIDGRIYVQIAQGIPGGPNLLSRYLHRFNCPNGLGSDASLELNAFDLNGSLAGYNLPTLNQTLFQNANILQAQAVHPVICLGDSTQLQAFGAGTTTFSWSPATGLSSDTSATPTATPQQTTTYTVTGTSTCGNVATATVTVIVEPIPVALAGVDRAVCSGEPTTLGAGALPSLSYSWSPASGLSDSTAANPVFLLPHASPTDTVLTYMLTVTSSAGCSSSEQVQVTLKPLPVVNAGAPVILCGGTPGQLQPQNQQPGYSYNWSPANGITDPTAFAPTLTLANSSGIPVFQTYTLTATFNGCSNSGTVPVSINPRPTGSLFGSLSVCPSVQGISYWFNSAPGTNAITWGVNGGIIAQQFGNDSITVNWGLSNSNAYVWAIPKNQYNCLGDTVRLPVQVNVLLVTPTPTGQLSVCVDPANIHNYATFHTNSSTYNWGISGGQIVSGNGSSQVQVQWQQPGQGQLWVLQQSVTATDTCFGQSDTLSVQLLPMPDSTLTVQGNTSLCAGTAATYSLAGDAGSNYLWQVQGGQLISGQGTGSIEVLWPTAGSFSISVVETNSSGCVGRLIGLQVQVNPLPATIISSAPPGACPGNSSNLSYSVQGLSGSSYSWYVDGGEIQSGQGSSQVMVNWNTDTAALNLTVTETSAFGCSGSEVAFTIRVDNTHLQLLRVTVDTTDESQVLVYYQVRDLLNYPQTEIEVRRQQNGGFSPVGSTATSGNVFTDAGLQTGQQAFLYRLQGQNLCADELLSTEHATVWLQGQANEQTGLVQLQWTPYVGWEDQPVQYQVWRKRDEQENYQLLPDLTTSATEAQAVLGPDGFTQCFRIIAIAPDTRQSWSNSICFNFTNLLLAPNIITPNGDGKNDVLIIEKLHLYPYSELTVMNRWGKEVYRSSNYQNNWGAEGLSPGVYFYQLQAPNQPLLKGWVEVMR